MSPDAQPLERYFSPSDPGQPPAAGPTRYQEELRDFTAFFERLASLDNMDWFATDEAAPAREPAPLPAQPDRVAAGAPEKEAPPRSETSEAPQATAAVDGNAPDVPAPKQIRRAAGAQASPPARTPRIHVFHSGLDALEPAPGHPGSGGDARAIVNETRPGGAWRVFFSRLQLVSLVVCGATLLFAMGLGMGALVLSLPRQAPFGTPPAPTASEPAPEREASASPGKPMPAATAETSAKLTTPVSELPSPRKGVKTAAAPASAAPVRTRRAQATPAQAVPSVPSVAEGESRRSALAQAPSGATLPGGQTPRPPEPPTQAAAPGNPAPASPGAPLPRAAGQEFALQVGACSSYGCVEQFRNLLLSEVESSVIQIMQSGGGAQPIQRIRVEPLSREAALRLKERLSAKDPRLAQAYLVSLR